MSSATSAPSVKPGGLVTVAYLKARLDEGDDHLGIFMPLVIDVIGQLTSSSFSTVDVQDELARQHGVAMPQQTLATLLKRAVRKGLISREAGRYIRKPVPRSSQSEIADQKRSISEKHQRLGKALCAFAASRDLSIGGADQAIDLLVRFLEDEQVGLLLGTSTTVVMTKEQSLQERAIVAEFVQAALEDGNEFRPVLREILEGIVLYHAAFLPDLETHTRQFRDLKVYFDSVLVRQALGYEGSAQQALLRESLNLLVAGGAQCFVFDKSVHEIQRILAMYEQKLATDEGRRSLRQVPMARHFLTQQYSPGEVCEMSALLEREVTAAGFRIQKMPQRLPEFTASEKALAARLADPKKKDEGEPRVVHDVDCVAAILTLRKGHRSATVEDARAVFVTSSPLVIANTRLWYTEDERETGLEPLVHIRALVNLAWLKKPTLSAEFKERELVALCAAALRPTQETWKRFLRHLDVLEKSKKLSSNEVTALLVSAMSDRLLREVESDEEDADDSDALTLDEVVERVKASYSEDSRSKVEAITRDYESRLADLEAREAATKAQLASAESKAAEALRRRELFHEERARRWAKRTSISIFSLLYVLVIAGAVSLILGHPLHAGWAGLAVGLAVVAFVVLELFGIVRHVTDWRLALEVRLATRFRFWLEGEAREPK